MFQITLFFVGMIPPSPPPADSPESDEEKERTHEDIR